MGSEMCIRDRSVRTSGGVGLGDPAERDAAAVALDVAEGYISHDRAEVEYGVAIDATTAYPSTVRADK